jgi:hypothetical protein
MDNLSLAIADTDRIDDLPRAFTYRRQRAQEEADAKRAPQAVPSFILDVSTGRLALFFMKCAVAAIPALVLLAAALWIAGVGLALLFPELLDVKITMPAPEASL